MKYNDYPMPDEKVMRVLSAEYEKQKNNVCTLSVSEQNAKLSELYFNLDLCNYYLEQLKMFGAVNIDGAIKTTKDNLNYFLAYKIDSKSQIAGNKKLNQKTCFFEYLKCEMEVLKTLMFLLLLDNVSLNKKELLSIANSRINIVIQGLN